MSVYLNYPSYPYNYGHWCNSCQSHVSSPHYCPGPMTYYPSTTYTYTTLPSSGWQCPGCSSCYAPTVTECPRCAVDEEPDRALPA